MKPTTNFILVFILVFIILSCKKKENKTFYKSYKNTTWQLIKVIDENGNDITSDVITDSIHCKTIEFNSNKLNDDNYEAIFKDCKGCFFEQYFGLWGGLYDGNQNYFHLKALDFYVSNILDFYSSTGSNQTITNSNELTITLKNKTRQRHTFKKID